MSLDPLSFVSSIELAPPIALLGATSNHKPVEPKDYEQDGYVVGGSILAFTKKVTGQDKRDILNGILFAQLASDKKWKREKQMKEWYACYKDVLQKIGFDIQELGCMKYKSSGLTFKVDKIILQILAAAVTSNEISAVKKTLAALESLSKDDNRLQVIRAYTNQCNAGNFEIGPCTVADNGDVTITFGFSYFKSEDHDTDFLFFRWNLGAMKIYNSTNKAILKRDVYGRVRDVITEKLGRQAINTILSIDI